MIQNVHLSERLCLQHLFLTVIVVAFCLGLLDPDSLLYRKAVFAGTASWYDACCMPLLAKVSN